MDVKALYNQISKLSSLAPSSEVNELFSKLVNYALDISNLNNLNKNEQNKLQRLCSKAEFELEKYWANRIINSDNPKETLESFTYFENYKKLTQLEWYSLLSCSYHKKHSILFVGSGPLPLSAIILATFYVNHVTVVDNDTTACTLSRKLITKLNLNKKITVLECDASEFNRYSEFNVIMIAALAGTNSSIKRKILTKVKNDATSDTHIVARSSWGLREILYKPIDKKLYKLFTPLIEVHPQNDVVNSIVILSNS